MNQKFLALAMTGALTLTLAACSGGAAKPTPTPSAVPPTTSVSPTPVLPTPSETVAPTQTPATSPTTTPTAKPTATPTAKPTSKPQPTPKPTAPAAASKVQSVWDEIAKQELPAFLDVDGETLTALYGLQAADLEEYICKTPMMNVQATEFFIAKVKDGKMDAVKTGIAKRQADLEKQWSTYLPDQYEIVQNYKVVTNGNYVLFVISGTADTAVTAFNTYTK